MPADGYVFVPNRASADVAVIDTRTDRLVTRLPVGNVPHQVSVSDVVDKLVASNTADDTISIIDLPTLATRTLRLDHEPEHMELDPSGVLLAVGNIGAGTVSLVSLAEEREVARIDGLFEPHNLTFSPDGSLLYVANLGASHVSVIDVAHAAIVDEIKVAEPPALAGKDDPGAEFQGIINVTATPDGRLGFAAHGEANELAVIDLRTRALRKSAGARRAALAGLHDGRWSLHARAQQRRPDTFGHLDFDSRGGGDPARRRGRHRRQHGLVRDHGVRAQPGRKEGGGL